MDVFLTVIGAIIGIVWIASTAFNFSIAHDAAQAERRPIDAYDWLVIALGPITALPLIFSAADLGDH